MKIGTSVALLTILSFISCKKNENLGLSENKEFKVDSTVVVDSMMIGESLKLNYSSTILRFPNIEDQELLDSIYAPYKKLSHFSEDSIRRYSQQEKDSFFNSIKDQHQSWMVSAGYTDKWYEKSRMKIKSNDHNFLHIQYSINSYMGGAHGNYAYNERVFDLENNKQLQLSDITTIDKESLSLLLRENLDSTKKSMQTIDNSEMLLVEKIPVTNNFYFDNNNIYFHYSPYEIAAYAAGDIIIPISWKKLNNTLTPEFKQRINL